MGLQACRWTPVAKTRVATNSYPLEMTFLRDAYRALHTRNGASVTLQRCIDIYERGDTMLGVTGLHRLSLFDERISSDKQKRLNNSFVCIKLELPVSTFPDAVLLTWPLATRVTYPSRIPSPQKRDSAARPMTFILSLLPHCKQPWRCMHPELRFLSKR